MRQKEAKERFLLAFAETGIVYKACVVAGVPRANIYRWLEHDERFSRAYHLANEISTERLEAEAYRRAHDGVESVKPVFHQGQVVGSITITEYSDGLLQFLLKARKPEKYKERLQLDVPMVLKTLVGVDPDAL